MGIIKSSGFVPGYGYVEDKNFIRNTSSIPTIREKYTSVDEKKFEEERTK